MHFTDITGLAGVTSLISLILFRYIDLLRVALMPRLLLVGSILAVVVMPMGGLSVAELVRGVTGDLSISTLLLLALSLHQTIRPHSVAELSLLASRINSVLLLVAVFALVLYPFALGLGMFDPYRLGFGNVWFVGALLLVALTAWLRQHSLVVLSISLAVFAWSVGWYESNNLWDYLLDPWVSIYALGVLIRQSVSLATKRFS
jgi:hypothetical protein